MNPLIRGSLILVIILLSSICNAQSVSTLIGARAQGLGYTSSCLEDEWSLFNNVAGLAKVNNTVAAFTYDAVPGFSYFNRTALALSTPTRIGTFGGGVFRYGDDLYSEQIISTGLSNTFGLASLGLKVNYIQYNAEGFGTRSVVGFSFGGIATLTPKLQVGAHISNINQPSISEDDDRLPTLLTAGFAYKPTDKFLFTTEIEKDLEYKLVWKAGLEYKVYKKLIARTGFNVKPSKAFFGLGFRPHRFNFDYAYSYSPDLVSRHQASIAYNFAKKV